MAHDICRWTWGHLWILNDNIQGIVTQTTAETLTRKYVFLNSDQIAVVDCELFLMDNLNHLKYEWKSFCCRGN